MPTMYSILAKKRAGLPLSGEEIGFFVAGVSDGTIPDYQTSALLMAICILGLSPEETTRLTLAMADSGERTDLSGIPGVKVDKHSTGGVGDKTTLITAPVVAACGVPVAKMSGRGLGFTGGTIDKLEAIPGLSTNLTLEGFKAQVQKIGLALAAQTGNLAPADKALYALRDLTATVDSIPLIASSVMSKKLAAGADKILLDVKVGAGAFMPTIEQAEELARCMVDIGRLAGRPVVALITDMEAPLGRAVGNSLEVEEAIDVLKGRGPADITELSLTLAAHMVAMATGDRPDHCRVRCEKALSDGSALIKLAEMVGAQGGDPRYITEDGYLAKAPIIRPFMATDSGYITRLDARLVGEASMLLGAGRTRKDQAIDPTAGLVLLNKPGDAVQAGQPVCLLHTSHNHNLSAALKVLSRAVSIGDTPPTPRPLIHTEISA
jgi:pyrimidine-nucleoside phosphorylase